MGCLKSQDMHGTLGGSMCTRRVCLPIFADGFCEVRIAMRSALPRRLVAVSMDICTERKISSLSMVLPSWFSCFVGPISSPGGEAGAPKDSFEASRARRRTQRLLTEACSEAALRLGLLWSVE